MLCFAAIYASHASTESIDASHEWTMTSPDLDGMADLREHHLNKL